ncbi:uncharacterized protein SCHCODRAFT_02625703 [Schizophyllum commune H4-8]|uniref:uncharacterized protein n=1 Tax=Schizophyllum commune (strain H4-8 / FGSC 9210) TaxID=578458 RepID=UPI002160A99C|nr:uncharacterized protein SCHCODRAFT_02625703 [Schizophyllum commune H4-8]KAI5892262.1 hypothetical protein SCHCODRAFT_02625703 [Schizophyllum commune H4-8]
MADLSDDNPPRLPLEILEYIICCVSDRKTCLTCALVCRFFVRPSRRRAFRRLKRRGLESVRKMSSLLESPHCTFAQETHWFSLNHDMSGDGGVTPLDCLQRLPNLATLRVERMTSSQCQLYLMGPLMRSLPHLTNLTLDYVSFLSFDMFLMVLAALPRLQSLSCRSLSFHGMRNVPWPAESGALRNLRFLSSDPMRAYDWRVFLEGMLAAPYRPPVEHLELKLPWPEVVICERICDLVNGFSPTLKFMRINPGFTQYVPEEYSTLDFARFRQLRSLTVEPTMHISDWFVRGQGDKLLDLLLRGLDAPHMQKIVFLITVNDSGPPEDSCHPKSPKKWAELDDRIACLPHFQEMKFVLSLCSPSMQRRGEHGLITDWLCGMLPKACARGLLRFRLVNNVVPQLGIIFRPGPQLLFRRPEVA